MVAMRGTARVSPVAGINGASHAKATALQLTLTEFSVAAQVDTRQQLVIGTSTAAPATFGDFDATPVTTTLGGVDLLSFNTDNQTASLTMNLGNGMNWGTVGHHAYAAYFEKTGALAGGDVPDAVIDLGVLGV